MIYPSDFEEKVGFKAVRELLSDKCISPLGVAKCYSMNFSADFNRVRKYLLQTAEMLSLVKSGVDMPIDNIYDVTPYLKEIKAEGSFISSKNLYKVKQSLIAMSSIKTFFCKTDENSLPLMPVLAEEFNKMILYPQLVSAIDSILDKFGDVRDSATEQLYEIRKSIASVNTSMSSIMRRVMDKAMRDGFIDSDTSPSLRDGRLVLPVASMMKRKINGIIHDESATGKTVYIEPAEVVEANNRLKELENAEKREIVRILTNVASLIRPHIEEMMSSYSLLGLFDFIRAKALFANEFECEMPILEKQQEIDWFHAVHPILYRSLIMQKRDVVPLDIKLDSKNRILIISGPNAGGKSVCLKTVGINQYMMQCGMLPMLYSNSHISVFENIFIDIGDEQSIENDLSTYSSHLKNMKYFINKSNKKTLILVDEMGSGTEPQIGGALAQSILNRLNASKVMGIVTTHYQNIKTFADATEGFVNGAMLYDRQNMCPMFQLSIGTPGSSFAVEIARKIGLPSDVIDEAQSIVGSDYVNMDKFLTDLARDKRYWSNKRISIKEKEQKLDSLLEQYEQKTEMLKSQRTEILKEARRQASEILSTTNATVERTIHEIKKSQAEKEKTKLIRKELEQYKKDIAKGNIDDSIPELLGPLKHKSQSNIKKQSAHLSQTEGVKVIFSIGDYVRMSDGGVVGKILSLNGNKVEVAFGGLRTFVDKKKIVKAQKPKETASVQIQTVTKSTSDDIRKRQLNFSQELDVRGMRVDEALQSLIYFIDDAIQFSASRVRVLHGTGTGALREAIRQQLKSMQNIISFHDEDVRFGGAGITVINLD